MSRWSRLSALLLIISLALNGFLGAYVASHWFGGGAGGPLVTTPKMVLTQMAQRLPEADQAIMLEAIAAQSDQLEVHQGGFDSIRREIGLLLAAPEVDIAAFELKLRAARDGRLASGEAIIAILIDALPRLSHATRLRIANEIEAM